MKNYLSFGAGVNSVALYLLMLNQGVEFEAIYVDHGADMPETHEYMEMFCAKFPVTILTPDVEGFSNIYEYYLHKRKVPSIMKRDCTDKFKLRSVYKYVEKPCFMFLGIDAGEARRARLNSKKGVENRYPLIEDGIDREGCKKLIISHGLPVPAKSGCFMCMFQKAVQWRNLRRVHPELYCKAQKMEKAAMDWSTEQGKRAFTLCNNGKTLDQFINEKQKALPGMEDLEYPPCHCGL